MFFIKDTERKAVGGNVVDALEEPVMFLIDDTSTGKAVYVPVEYPLEDFMLCLLEDTEAELVGDSVMVPLEDSVVFFIEDTNIGKALEDSMVC